MTEYLIATSVLEAIVRGSLDKDDRLRFHSALPLVRSHPVELAVDADTCYVTVQLDVRMGEHLPLLAAEVRQKIAASLGCMTGLAVSGVDVVFGGVFPPGA
jgi:uncharacterized alkaline shock family protein YloU